MALKIPSLTTKDNKKTATSPVTASKPPAAGKKSGSFLEKLFGPKKSSATTSTIGDRKESNVDAGPTTGAAGTTGTQTRKIKADVAAASSA
jgi:hypothetical protein